MNQKRINAVLEEMSSRGIDHLIISEPSSINYLINYENNPGERMYVLLLSLDGNHTLFLNKLFYLDQELSLNIVWYDDTQDGAVLVFEEVGAHPLAEALGLAHVDDLSRAVEKLVYARRERQQRRLFARRERGMFVRFGHRGKISNYSAKSPARTAESRPGAPGKRHARRQNTQHGVFQI